MTLIVQQNYPLLYKTLSNWPKEPERPPLLLTGISEKEGLWFKEEIVKLFTKKISITSELKNHPDILCLERAVGKQNIEVKQVREFVGRLALSNFELPFKIGIIPSAHHLNIQSQNALLKTFEEPLKKRYLILGTVSKYKLLPTILSRSIVFNVKKIADESGKAKDIVENYEFFKGMETFYKDCQEASLAERIYKGNQWNEGKTEKIKEFFNFIIPEIHSELIAELKRSNLQAVKKLVENLQKAVNYANQLENTSGANPKLLFEAFLLQL